MGIGGVCAAGLALGAVLGGCAGFSKCDLHACRLDEDTPGPRGSSGLGPPIAIAREVRHGAIDCFEAGLRSEKHPDRLAYCEGSAVVFDGRRLVLASDKPIPGGAPSSLFELPFRPDERAPAERASRYLEGASFAEARKLEDATVTPDGHRVFLTTGFDRVKADGSADWDGYNVLLSYPVDRPEATVVVGPDTAPRSTSVALRDVLRPHVRTAGFPEGAPYFKVEGLAAAPGHRLLFGIREAGASYQAFEYMVLILEARWHEVGDRVVLEPDSVRVVYRFDALEMGGHRVGLSSLEYDRVSQRYWMLVSYEYEEDRDVVGQRSALGGFLLSLDEAEMARGAPPRPVIDPSGHAVHFQNKPEGLTMVGPGTLMVLFDDDRVLDCGHPEHAHRRRPHQTALGLIELESLTTYAAGRGSTSPTP